MWEEAACRGLPTDWFFPGPRPRPNAVNAEAVERWDTQVATVKAMCRACPLRTECLSHGLARTNEGIWGGLTESERRAFLRRKRARKRTGAVIGGE